MEINNDNLENKKSKMPMIIGVCIVILIILIALILYAIMYLRSSITTITIDGQKNEKIEEILYLESTENGLELYVPIIKMSQFLNYEGFTGDYLNKSEDKTKCHVKNEYETAMFTQDSNILVKIPNGGQEQYIELDKPVFEKDGELFTTIAGIESAFNVQISYDNTFKNIKIWSMDYLLSYAALQLKLTEENYSTDFLDKKAIFQNMIITRSNNLYGVIDIENKKNILENKYEHISYLPVTNEFLIKSNGKYGIVTKEGTSKLKTIYNEIKIMDNENGLYIVNLNNLFGIVNTDGKVIISPEYRQIGVGYSRYQQNGVNNQYVLLDEIIPLKNDQDKWALYNIKGEQITEFKYTGIGCEKAPISNTYPVVVIPSHKIIVMQNAESYNLLTIDGEELISGNILGSVYMKLNAITEEKQFFMTSKNNEKVMNIEDWLTNIGR